MFPQVSHNEIVCASPPSLKEVEFWSLSPYQLEKFGIPTTAMRYGCEEPDGVSSYAKKDYDSVCVFLLMLSLILM